MQNWDDFQHEYVGEPKAEAFWKDGELRVRVSVFAKHWIGPHKPPWLVKHSMGYILQIPDMVLVSENGEVPYRRCLGFERCQQCRNSALSVEKK